MLVVAKAPVAGQVKTRLVPPLSYEEAARVAEASLAQTLQAVSDSSADRKLLALDGEPGGWIPPGFAVFSQVDGTLGTRLAAAWFEADGPGLQIGMDTPQVTSQLIDDCLRRLCTPGISAALGLAPDGGWWALGMRERWGTDVFRDVPMSTDRTGQKQLESLHAAGHTVSLLPMLRDVDTAADADVVAGSIPDSQFASIWLEAMGRV